MKHGVRAILLTLVFPLAGDLAAEPGDTVDIDGVWGISERGTAGEGVNCDRWASGAAGDASAISDTDPGIQNQATGDENQIRYGAQDVNDDPPPCHEFANQSGFGFDGVDGAEIPSVGTPYKLGVFTHYNAVTNIDLADYNPLENVVLTLTLTGGVSAVLKASVELVETANDDDPCRFPEAPNDPPCGERISIVPHLQSVASLEIDGVQYDLELSGFANCEKPGTPSRVLYTHEMAADQACLYARLVATPDADSQIHGMETGHDIPEIDALFEHWDTPGSPGCAVAVSQNGSLVYSRGFGYANLDYDIPVTPQTVFDVASVTKQFVAASLSMLAQEGKLSFDDDIRKWLPELPEYEWPITLEHMVYHTSGLRDYLNLFPLAGRDDYYPISHEQILDMMSRQQALVFQPGERYMYSNTAYMLLAQVVQRVSGKSLGEFVQARIFGPLEMKGSLMYDDFERIIPYRAIGYVRDDDDSVRMTHNYNFDVAGDGQMYTTVEDLLRWDDYLHGADKPEIYPVIMLEGTLSSGVKTRRAKGLFLDEYRGLPTVHHTGSSWGFRTVVKRFADFGLGIAIACNDDNSYPRRLAFKIADYYLADQLGAVPAEENYDESPEADTLPEPPILTMGQLAEFTGEFRSFELDATYRVNVVDGDLAVRVEQQSLRKGEPAADDRFRIMRYGQVDSGRPFATIGFTRNEFGDITGFILDSGTERGIVFEKQQ